MCHGPTCRRRSYETRSTKDLRMIVFNAIKINSQVSASQREENGSFQWHTYYTLQDFPRPSAREGDE